MKLLWCPECGDIFAIHRAEERTCRCGATSGQYLRDGWRAVVWGPGLMIGFDNNYMDRVRQLRGSTAYKDENLAIPAWVMPESAPRITYHREGKPK